MPERDAAMPISHPRGAARSNAKSSPNERHNWNLRTLMRRAAREMLGGYQFNRIYHLALPTKAGAAVPAGIDIRPILDARELADHPDPAIRRTMSYGGRGAWGYSAWCDGALVAVCWVWSSERFSNGIVRISPRERSLVEIYTQPAFRGRSIGPALISRAASDAAKDGCTGMVTWIWWSNKPSIRAFEKSGWVNRAFAFTLEPFGRRLNGTWSHKPGA